MIAHRGASKAAAEHSLEAYEQAIDEGADGLECDVRMTLDGHLVCVHDRRIERTSDGWGAVSSKTLRELHLHDFVTWAEGPKMTSREARIASLRARALQPVSVRSARLADATRAGATRAGAPGADSPRASDRVLTLSRLLELVVSTPRPLKLAIETKHPTRYAGLVEREVVEQLRHFGLHRTPKPDRTSVQVMSFSAQAVRRMRALAPVIPSVYLMDRIPVRMRDGFLPFGATIAGPGVDILREYPGYVAKVQKRGGQVHVWTVDSREDVELCLELGVDAIISNTPAAVRGYMADWAARGATG